MGLSLSPRPDTLRNNVGRAGVCTLSLHLVCIINCQPEPQVQVYSTQTWHYAAYTISAVCTILSSKHSARDSTAETLEHPGCLHGSRVHPPTSTSTAIHDDDAPLSAESKKKSFYFSSLFDPKVDGAGAGVAFSLFSLALSTEFTFHSPLLFALNSLFPSASNPIDRLRICLSKYGLDSHL